MVEARRANVVRADQPAILSAGSDIVIHGFVFPVGEPHTFGDSFGAPRMVGTEFAHAHQGTDIFAPMGTPARGLRARRHHARSGTDVLGGNKLWLKGESGTYYYYAHLERASPRAWPTASSSMPARSSATSATRATPRAGRRTSTSRSTPTAVRP